MARGFYNNNYRNVSQRVPAQQKSQTSGCKTCGGHIELQNNCGCNIRSGQCHPTPQPILEVHPYRKVVEETYVTRIPQGKLCYPYEILTPFCAIEACDIPVDKSFEFCTNKTINAFIFEFKAKCKTGMTPEEAQIALLKEAWKKIRLFKGTEDLLVPEGITPDFVYQDMKTWAQETPLLRHGKIKIRGKLQEGCWIKAEFILRLGFGNCRDITSYCDLLEDVGFSTGKCTYVQFFMNANKPEDKFSQKSLLLKELVGAMTPKYSTKWSKFEEKIIEGENCWTYLDLPIAGKIVKLYMMPEITLDDGVKDYKDLTVHEMELVKKMCNDNAEYTELMNKRICDDIDLWNNETNRNLNVVLFGCSTSCMPDVDCESKIRIKGKTGQKVKYFYQVVY
ncbi:MAG: hypothetical protein FWF27_00975 [Candidatus Bathyarchaeota archaeon]|nr:hypothetical protein [Candidatus Termiticorpusculum sp.]